MILNKLKYLRFHTGSILRLVSRFSDDKTIKPENSLPSQLKKTDVVQKIDGKQIITQLPESELFELKQNVTPVPGNTEQRQFSSLSELQRQIIESKEFNLMDKRIKLQQMGISSIMEQNLTKVDLGEVSIKNKNQILLQDVDPNNIPEDMDIVFESKKKLTLVGKRLKKSENIGDKYTMKISDSSFEQKSIAEFRGEEFKMGKANMIFNRVEFLRFSIMLLPFLFLVAPFIDANNELAATQTSIIQIQQQQADNIRKIKKYYYRKMLVENPELV